MGVILVLKDPNRDTGLPFSMPVSRSRFSQMDLKNHQRLKTDNRKTLALHDHAIIFKNHGWLFEHQMESPHTTREYLNPTRNANDGFRQLTHEAEPLPSTPGATPLRTHNVLTSTERLLDPTTTSLPSLLPATGTTLFLLPSLSTRSTFISATMTSSVLSDIPTAYETHPSNSPSMATQTRNHLRLPIVAIAAITAGGFCALIVSFLLFLWLRTPKRRKIPRPSLPRLENSDFDEKDIVQESPLFGPKERFSQRPVFHPTWSWVTYPQKKATTEENETSHGADTSQSPGPTAPRLPQEVAAIDSHRKRSSSVYPVSGHFHTLSAPVGSPLLGTDQPSLHQVQAAITRATNRMSTMSFTYTPNCPKVKDSGTTFTADGHDMLKRQSRTLRKSRSNSMYEDRRRLSHASTGIAYDGADVNSPVPVMEFMPLDSPGLDDGYDPKAERRTRIQVPYYAAGSYPRISSTIPTTYGVATRVKLGEGQSIKGVSSPETNYIQENQALTRALGLTPSLIDESFPSPQPTLYPDDSLSVVESKRLLKQRSQKKRASAYFGDLGQFNQVSDGRRQHIVTTPTRSVVAVASGSLVSAEDIKALTTGNNTNNVGMTVGFAGITPISGKPMGTTSKASSKVEGRADDKPPRVPSPPPLPSLAQMALEHNNPDGYTSYRSPTYSIYNLYDENRRSTFYGAKQ